MAFMVIEIDTGTNASVTNLNTKVGDSTNPHDGVVQLRNLMDAILAGTLDSEVEVVVRDTSQSISASGGGASATYNLK